MRAELGWLLAGGAIGATIAVMAMTDVERGLAGGNGGYNSVDRAAAKAFGWGTKQRAEGKVGSVVGSVKEGVGRFTGDTNLEAEGTVDKVTGKVKDAVGEIETAAAQTLHDLNK